MGNKENFEQLEREPIMTVKVALGHVNRPWNKTEQIRTETEDKLYDFLTERDDLKIDDTVVVETSRGLVLGTVKGILPYVTKVGQRWIVDKVDTEHWNEAKEMKREIADLQKQMFEQHSLIRRDHPSLPKRGQIAYYKDMVQFAIADEAYDMMLDKWLDLVGYIVSPNE